MLQSHAVRSLFFVFSVPLRASNHNHNHMEEDQGISKKILGRVTSIDDAFNDIDHPPSRAPQLQGKTKPTNSVF